MPLPILTAQGEVRDKDGNLVENEPAASNWHESFRYFRLAQSTDDLFDAFRNIYLAVEAVLSTIAPQHLGRSGRPSEGEGDWFKRALGVAAQHVDLSRYTTNKDATTALDDLFDEMYGVTRTAVFHAKAGRPVLIPMDMTARPRVLDSLTRLATFFVELSDKVLAVRYGSSFIFTGGFHMMAKAMLSNSRIVLTSIVQDTNPDVTTLGGGAADRAELAAEPADEFRQSFRAMYSGRALVSELAGRVPRVRSVVLAVNDELQPAIMFDPEGFIDLDDVHRVSAVIGIRGLNTQMLRRHYAS